MITDPLQISTAIVLILAWIIGIYIVYHSQQKQKDEGTLSVPASGDTKQTDKELQLERSAPALADNHSADQSGAPLRIGEDADAQFLGGKASGSVDNPSRQSVEA